MECKPKRVDEVVPLLVQGIEVRTDDGEVFRAFERAKAAGDFLLYFGHPDGAFAEIMPTPGLCRVSWCADTLLVSRADDTEMALGSDVITAALDGYALAQVFGKGSGLDAMRETMAARFGRKRKNVQAPAG